MASLESFVKKFFATLDRRDFDTLLLTVDRDAEGIDEITRKWLRGKRAFVEYVKRIGPEMKNIKSTLRDLHTRQVGGAGIATFFLHQSYTLSGRRQKLKAPTTMVFVRRAGDWKLSLFHSTPLAD